MKIPKQELLDEEICWKGQRVVEDNIIDHTRWSVIHKVVFHWTDDKYYSTTYRVGATESQDEQPWEYENEVECEEVVKKEKVIEVWEKV